MAVIVGSFTKDERIALIYCLQTAVISLHCSHPGQKATIDAAQHVWKVAQN